MIKSSKPSPSMSQAPAPPCIAVTPFETPDPSLLRALRRTGALVVLALGRDRARAESALREAASTQKPFGVVLPEPLVELELPAMLGWIVLERPQPLTALRAAGRRVLVQVCEATRRARPLPTGSTG